MLFRTLGGRSGLNPRWEFLNHAKFLVFYHVCFSGRVIYHGKYCGSTNLTIAGLAYRRGIGGSRGIGNYEEFTISNPRPRLNLGRGDVFYLSEVLNLVTHKASLYVNPNYLRKYLLDHLMRMESILHNSRRIISGTSLGELYETCVDLLVVYDQTYALLDEVPGKGLTREIEEELAKMKPPVNPFELELMIPIDRDQAELLAKDLGLQYAALRKMIREYIDVLESACRLIKERYLAKLERVRDYFDVKERSFMEFIERNNTRHRRSLERIIGTAAKFGKLGQL